MKRKRTTPLRGLYDTDTMNGWVGSQAKISSRHTVNLSGVVDHRRQVRTAQR
jgi:hypothetical protein